MSITQRIRDGAERALIVQMEHVNQKLVKQVPIPDSTAPPLDELDRILADLHERQPRRSVYLRNAI